MMVRSASGRSAVPSPAPAATPTRPETSSFAAFAQRADYSLLEALRSDPQATADGCDHQPRQVFSGHYVPVRPTPLPEPQLVAFSPALFNELGLSEALAADPQFQRLFSGDISVAQAPMQPYGWATGYALSIYGSEYSRAGAGSCSSRAVGRRPTAAAPMAAPCCARACVNSWPRSSCTPWGCPHPAR